MRALIVEDMPESQALLCEVAAQAFPGIVCDCVADVSSALAQLGQDYRLALVDLSLPDGSGIAVVERFSRAQPECTLVVATIFGDDEHLFAALRAGAQGYLLKDEPPELLVRALEGIRDGRLPLSPAVARRILGYFRQQSGAPAAEAAERVTLTPRECEVLSLLARGLRIAEISRELGISHHTAGDHVKNIYRKLNISSRAEAALQAKQLGLL
ncbi:MAG: response regulator transcription factor [Rhodocyclaceae bacterium]|nr:response regulator transcription factor [Rhodocyclaceae bacterium]